MENLEVDNVGLVQLGEALIDVAGELKRIPAFKVLAQDALREELWKVAPGILVSKIFVNVVAGSKPSQNEPVGRLLDVLLECLQRGQTPDYDSSVYAIFDHPNLTDRQDAILQISISDIEMVVRRVIGSFATCYVSALQRYWENTSIQDSSSGYPQLSRKAALGVSQSVLFMRELEVLVDQDGFTLKEATVLRQLIQPGLTGTCYGVALQGKNGEYIEQTSMFVLPLDGPVYDQLLSASEVPLAFYSPERGIEKFTSASQLHQALSSRLSSADTRAEFFQSLSGSEQSGLASVSVIRFSKVRANLFERYTDKLLKTLYVDITQPLALLNSSGSDFYGAIKVIESAQSLQNIPRQAKLRQASLLRRVQQNAWPQWLKEADKESQKVYVALEQRLLESQVQYHEATKGFASFKDFVREKVEDFLSPGSDQRIDPDTVFAKVTYVASLASGQKIEHSERKTLTQLFMYGIHDDGHQLQIVVEGQYYNSKYTQTNLTHAIRTMGLRSAYNDARKTVFEKINVFESLRELHGRKAALSLYRAGLRGHLSSHVNSLLTRYHSGELSMLISGRMALAKGLQRFKDLMVYTRRNGIDEQVVLFAPGFPSGQEWFEFDHILILRDQVSKWVADEKNWEYLKSQAIVSDIPKMTAHVTGDVWAPRWIAPSDLVFSFVSENFPQENAIKGNLDWESQQAEAVTPFWYRKSKVEDQQLFTRLNTDFKLFSGASKDALAIIPFHQFSRDLVMKTLHQYLSREGRSVPVIDPDKVLVKFHAGPEMTLTNLFIQWQLWRSDVSIFEKVFHHPLIGESVHDLKDRLRTAMFRNLDGYTVHELNAQVINALIDLKPGEFYDQYLREKFLLADDRPLKENLFLKVKQNEMLRTALLQKINGSLSQDQFNWLQALINGFDRDLPRGDIIEGGGKPGPGVYGFTLEGRTVTGAYVFGRIFNGRLEQIVYVPGSHDGKDFFALEKLADRLKLRAFTNDVLKLVWLSRKAVVENLMRKYWDKPVQATLAPELVNSHQIKSFSKGEYGSLIGKLVDDVDFQTTSSAEVYWRDARILIEFALDVASLFVPPLGLGLSVLRITQSVVQGVVASSHGSESEANAHFASAWRGAIMLYLGKVAAIGAPVNPLGLLSQIKDYADLMSTVTGVPLTESYLTAVAVPPHAIESTTRLIN